MMDFDLVTTGMLDITKGIVESGKTVVPMAFIIAPDGRWKIIGLMWRDEETKTAMYQKLSAEAKQLHAVAVFLINDMWIRFGDAEWSRHEALYAQMVMPDGSVMKCTTLPYLREPGGPIKWGPPVVSEEALTEQNLLPAWGILPTA